MSTGRSQETYIEHLNSIVEWLENEQFSITDNIINLKLIHSKSQEEYNALAVAIEEQKRMYSDLVLKNARMTYTQNAQVLEEIRIERERQIRSSDELSRREADMIIRESELMIREANVSVESERLDREKKRQTVSGEYIENADRRQSDLDRMLREKKHEMMVLRAKISEQLSDMDRARKADEERKRLKEAELDLRERNLELLENDMKRREDEMRADMASRQSEWSQLRSAKAHLEMMRKQIEK